MNRLSKMFSRTFCSLALVLTMLVISSKPASAQAEGVAKEPVFVVSIASLDGLLRDVSHISTISGMPQAGAMLGLYVGAYSEGLDKSKPIGVVVRMNDGVPAPMVFMAVKDPKAVLKRLEPQFGPADELDDGTMVMQAGQNLVYIRGEGDWTFIAQDRSFLDKLPEDPETLLQGMHLDHDIGIRGNIQLVPEPIRMGLMAQMRQAFEDTMKRMQEEGEGGEMQAPNAGALENMEMAVRDSEYLTMGISIDSQRNKVSVDFSSTALAGTELAKVYNGRKPIASKFAGFVRPSAAAYFHVASTFSEQEQALSLASLDDSTKQIEALLAQQYDLEKIQDKIDEYMPRAKELLTALIKSGKMDAGFVGLTEGNRVRALYGMSVPDGRKVESLVKDVYAEFQGEPNAPSFKFDDGTLGDFTLHRGTLGLPDREELQKVFGDAMPILIAVSSDAVFVGVGNDVEDLLKETIDASAGDSAGTDLPLSHGVVSALPILEFAQWVGENSILDMLLKTIRSNANNDKIEFAQPVEPNGQRVVFSVDDGVLQVIGAAVKSGQNRPAF